MKFKYIINGINKKILKEYQENIHVIDDGISENELANLIHQLGIDFEEEQFSFDDLIDGANHEIEHKKEVDSSPSKIVQIAIDHLRENPKYYRLLNAYIKE